MPPPGVAVVIVVAGIDAGAVDVFVLDARVVLVADDWAVVLVLFGLAAGAADGVSSTAAATIVAVVAGRISGSVDCL